MNLVGLTPVEQRTLGDEAADRLRAAIRNGVLKPGTQMRGFVYFESAESSANTATLTWHLTTPEHAPLVDLRFPLWVSRPSRRG